ncbi:hypothetical protein D623_10018465 [Myotis brandtii]|uniref:Regulator of hemoglobinization and erythroid cell expansion protein n=1 Tax=Myotis brandtii TaxID=109478 RepID=S7QEG1_MYOBR|nr:hypothetical protein D623_10018465 [Myotis brandtii]
MQLWHGLVIAFVSLVLQACLLAAIYYLLSRHMDNCHTSSESSDTSDSAGHSPPTGQATRNVNYTQVVFPATGRLENTSALDYEDIEDMTDYVNVDPKSHKHNFWTFVNPAASEPVEYSQVAM